MSFVFIAGANSDIAKAVAREFAKNGFDLYLGARNTDTIASFAHDLRIRSGRQAIPVVMDILDIQKNDRLYGQLEEKPIGVIVAVGYLGDEKRARIDPDEARLIMDTNYMAPVTFLNKIADEFERQASGFIIGISSVAGDRGRKKNSIYGSSKAAFSAYLSGLRNRLHTANVNVLTVKPGFVRTKMTKNMELPPRLTATSEEVARAIYKAHVKKRNILYCKSIWRWIMVAIRLLPEPVFKRLDL